MIERQGDLWSAVFDADLLCITTSGTLDQRGNLVMNQGLAQQAARRYPTLKRVAGQAVRAARRTQLSYGLLPLSVEPIALFQVECPWQDRAALTLIKHSVQSLLEWSAAFTLQEGHVPNIHLNFPGIGAGGLTRAQIRPLLARLPNSVSVWTCA